MPWISKDFVHPERLDLASGHHLRPIRESDVDLDYPAVTGSRERLWRIYGDAWGWPPESLTREQDGAELAWHEDEMREGRSFNYAILDSDETELLGCVYIDPSEDGKQADAVVSWWVVDQAVGTAVAMALDQMIPRWLDTFWPFERVLFGVRS